MNLPTPSRMRCPARSDVRERWIGRKVRYHKKHRTFLPRTKEQEAKQAIWRARGISEVLYVGAAMWLLVRSSNGEEEQVHKVDIEVV